jgi:hypothetical protein
METNFNVVMADRTHAVSALSTGLANCGRRGRIATVSLTVIVH